VIPSGDVSARIFVVGVPRSGTTLVQSLLAAHRALTSFTESHFFSRHFRPLPRVAGAVLLRDPRPRLREFLGENGVGPESDAAAEIEERLRRALPMGLFWPLASGTVARELVGALDDLARLRGVGGWVEKTPRHLRFLPFLERLLGDREPPWFLHVIREGLDTVASLNAASRNWQRHYDLETCVERWNEDVAFSLGRVGCPNDRFIFYEELTASPEDAAARLLESLELAPEPDLVARYGERADRLVTGVETWKSNVAGGIRRAGTSRDALTDQQRREVEKGLRHDLYRRLRRAVS
jgi:hypothetical protein